MIDHSEGSNIFQTFTGIINQNFIYANAQFYNVLQVQMKISEYKLSPLIREKECIMSLCQGNIVM